MAEGNCADAYALEGRLDEAIAGFRSSLRTSLDRGMVEQQPHAATGLARALLMKDPTQRDEVAELAELLDRLAVSGDVDTRRRALTTRAMLASVRGQDGRMLDFAKHAMRLGDRVRHQAGAFATPLEACWIAALAARRLGDETEAAVNRGRALGLIARVARALPGPSERSSLHHGHPIHRAVLAGEWTPAPGWTWDPA